MIDIKDDRIKWFRELFSQQNFGYWRYYSFEGKNLFNPICSCMDWINVAIRSINGKSVYSDDIDVRAMEIFSLISSIDLVVESITTLDTIIFSKSKRESPYKGDKRIFTKNEFTDDDEFFTQLRAVFGAHPVNLKNDKHERLYASWPYHSPSDGSDLQVLLYSNLPDRTPIKFGLRINELSEYLKTRYDHLSILGEELINQFNQSTNEYTRKVIEKNSNPLNQIEILTTEVKKRMNNEFLAGELYELNELFSATLQDTNLADLENDFKNKLIPYIDELYDHLQRMDFDSPVKQPDCYNLAVLYASDSYVLEKYLNVLSNGDLDPLIDYYISVFNKLGDGVITFNKNDSSNISRLKLYLLSYMLAKYS